MAQGLRWAPGPSSGADARPSGLGRPRRLRTWHGIVRPGLAPSLCASRRPSIQKDRYRTPVRDTGPVGAGIGLTAADDRIGVLEWKVVIVMRQAWTRPSC
jgi:hypothetical protein